MTIQERFETLKKSGAEVPRPLELFAELDEKSALAHLDSKAATFAAGAVPSKYKYLMALAAAVALDSPSCAMNNTKLARKSGASKAEIMETIAVAKFSKSATALSTAAQALEWLVPQAD